eukprot:5047649-Amphidinium_carterae.1
MSSDGALNSSLLNTISSHPCRDWLRHVPVCGSDSLLGLQRTMRFTWPLHHQRSRDENAKAARREQLSSPLL